MAMAAIAAADVGGKAVQQGQFKRSTEQRDASGPGYKHMGWSHNGRFATSSLRLVTSITDLSSPRAHKGSRSRGAVMLTVPTTCPFCACGCGFYLLVREEQLVGVAPSENHPVSVGKLCARGWSAHEATLWGNRLRQPLVKRNGNPEPIAWVTALDHVVARLKELWEAGKPIGILGSAGSTNEENYLAAKLARAALHTNNVDFSYRSICRPVLEGLEDVIGSSTPSVSLRDIESSDAILLIEGDLAETQPQAASAVMRALHNQARLITIGCRRTQMARLASLHFPTAPENEGEVINDVLAAAIRLARGGGLKTRPDTASEGTSATGAPHQAAEWIATAKRATFLMPPIGPHDRCRKSTAALATLAAVTGHLDKRGSGLLPLLARSNARGACDMGVAPDRLPGYEPLSDQNAQERLQKVWHVSLPSDPGMDAETLIQNVSGLIILADDPGSVLPMGQRATAALRNVEFMVALDPFVTPTVELAHVALPIAGFGEAEGTVTSMENRVQRLRMATDPPGDARAGWRVLAELCARLGVNASYGSARDVLDEIAQAAPRYADVERVHDEGWSHTFVRSANGATVVLRGSASPAQSSAEHALVLGYKDSFDWGRDPLVLFSPTLSRDFRSERKFFPNGVVEICQQDADKLGVHAGRPVRLRSERGEATVPIRVNASLKPGVLLVPYAFRDHVASVLGENSAAAVKVEQA